MAIDFPNSPSSGDTHTDGGAVWKWNGYAWRRVPDPGAKGEPGAKGQKGEIGSTGSQGDKGDKGEIGGAPVGQIVSWSGSAGSAWNRSRLCPFRSQAAQHHGDLR